ncbi:MAG TPA: PIN domain-containing protein [Vitreimonas sp.]|uniref:PIN domain-containing protein n=1 Tax=Vitreimonas sp. TaxID=3069702 RepID=UPI002D4D7CBA|nr:PIN domain-containing protein [Vitreimonas sp.]HYD89604.1 PIN domain-containing protein [Vitreimonas sp.]
MIVIDTSVVIAGIRSPTGASAKVLEMVVSGRLEAAASTALGLEYEAVATRAEHLAAAGLSRAEALIILDALTAMMKDTPIRWQLRPLSSDPNDDLVLEAAFNAGAHLIVTNNPRDFERSSPALGIRTIAPHVILSEMER